MNEHFAYIMYPIKIEKLKKLGIGFDEEKQVIEIEENENFVPLWYGTACFPEDERDE